MSIFTRYAMDALMKTTHPEVNRKQCWTGMYTGCWHGFSISASR